MAVLKSKDINKMGKKEKEDKLKELRIELIKAKVGSKKSAKLNEKEIKRAIARLLTALNKSEEEKQKK